MAWASSDVYSASDLFAEMFGLFERLNLPLIYDEFCFIYHPSFLELFGQ
jgi:hypothetical protein